MILDYHESTKCFTLRVPRGDAAKIDDLMTAQGWDFSTPASDRGTAVLFTKEPYAAVGYIDHATPFARVQLQGISDLVAQSWKAESNAHIKCPMDKELWAFQRAGVEYALPRRHTLLGDQPGCGKTETAICYANEINAKRVLVLCPASIRLQWADRIREWSTMPWPFVIYPIIAGRYGVHPQAAWTIVSYDLARTEPIGRALAQGLYDLIILDEAHYLKTIDSGRTRAIFGDHTGMCREPIRNDSGKITGYNDLFPALASRCGATMALTGTPLPNRPRECLDASAQVLTNRGWQPIVSVALTDKLWDGIEWVNHHGLLFQGCAKTVSVAGILATETHRFLAKSTWVSAVEAVQSLGIKNQLLETGLENLPSPTWSVVLEAAFGELVASASVGAKQLPQFNDWLSGARTNVGHAVQKRALSQGMKPTNSFAPTTNYDNAFLQLFWEQCSAGQTRIPPATKLMAAEELKFTRPGLEIEKLFWRILFRYLAMKTPIFNWTGLTMTEAMSRATSDGPHGKKICEIEELLKKCKDASSTLRPVFDIANAGPRQRFMVLSEDGPVISHNCYSLARNLCFDSIDWMSEVDFNERFNPVAKIDGVRKDGSSYTYTKERAGRAGELQARLRANFMVRHLKRDVMPQLKLPVYDIVQVEETKAVKQVLEAESFLEIDPESFDGSDIEILGHVAVVRHQMGLAIAPQVADYAAMCIDGGEEKLVIFAWHKDVCDLLQQRLARFGVLRIDGSTTPQQRKAKVDKFIVDRSVRVMLGNTLALGTGTDGLQRVAAHALLAEPEWVPGNNEQAIDRLDRGGQTRTVQADLFVAPGSILQKILASALRKRQNTHLALDARN